MYIYLNGEILDQSKAQISAYDHGFMYGLGVFETFRIYNGHPFLLDDHFLRLEKSAAELSISFSYSRDEVCAILQQLCKANQLDDAYIRWNLSAGIGEIGLQVDPYNSPTTIVYIKELPNSMANHKKGKILTIRRNSPEGGERLKSHHYLNNIMGKKELGSSLEYEGIFLNDQGYLAEGIVSNIFWVKEGTVYTPSIDTGILNGITRQFVLALLKKMGIPFEEGKFQLMDILEADEAFITNSIQEIVALKQIDDVKMKHQSITEKLQQSYSLYKDKLWTINDLRIKE